MVAPVVMAAGIGAAAKIGSGILADKQAAKQQQKALDAQREFAQHGIQWRVEDAKAAGLHPLFALGANTTGPTIPVMESQFARSLGEAGQDIGRAVAATQTVEQRQANELTLRTMSANARIAEAQALELESRAARAQQESLWTGPWPSGTLNQSPQQYESFVYANPSGSGVRARGPSSSENIVQIEPSKRTSSTPGEPGIEAAQGTGLKWFHFPGGRRALLPAGDSLSDSLESLSESHLLLAWVVAENVKANPNFVEEFADVIPGLSTVQKAQEARGTWEKFRDWVTDPDTYSRNPAHTMRQYELRGKKQFGKGFGSPYTPGRGGRNYK